MYFNFVTTKNKSNFIFKIKPMKKLISITLLCIISLSFLKCEDYDDTLRQTTAKDFVWRGLNQYYYWLTDSPDLADDRFATNAEYTTFTDGFATPEALFQHLRIDNAIDRFSVIYSDYNALEQALTGTQDNNGMDFELRRISAGSDEIFGWVRYVLPNSIAALNGVTRGMIFNAINGQMLTVSNYSNLINQANYTINLADYNGGNIIANGTSISLTKQPFSENPVHKTNTFTLGSKKVGYLMYNGFYSSYDEQLNQAFADFANENLTHFILDLRYNSGGSIASATHLASMITGQFNGQVFAKQEWNYKAEDYYNSNNPEALIDRFTNTLSSGTAINSINTTKLYILTSSRTASASELVINCLEPYINVTKIGSTTTGKNVGSVTLYDSPNFRKQNLNPTHKYAMQPIVLSVVNKNNFGDYHLGINADVDFEENLGNLGVLGETSDPFLSAALDYINANGRINPNYTERKHPVLIDKKGIENPNFGMYLER